MLAFSLYGLYSLFYELFVLLLPFYGIGVIFSIISLIDILKNKFEDNEKLIWVIVVLGSNFLFVFNIISNILYYEIGRKQKIE
ncbi:hypothetical protein V9L05_18980 [Bernardetia sp. Wsw4-3y2]|uniref:hypothetical protein n=1 Tax=Bernardetia sp. Wsw4-3y2 TaxID=3127471 RepID=UPI0030CF6B96